MSVSLKSLGIDRLSVADRLILVEELWDSIAAATPLTDAQRAELDRRLADHEVNFERYATRYPAVISCRRR